MANPSARKPSWPLGVVAALRKIDRQTTEALEDCARAGGHLGFGLDDERVRETMQASAIESFRVRADCYQAQPGFRAEWLDELIDETVNGTLKLAPLSLLLGVSYPKAEPGIRKKLRAELERERDAREEVPKSASINPWTANAGRESILAQDSESARRVDQDPSDILAPAPNEPRDLDGSRRRPDVQTSQTRIDLVEKLARELAIIKQETRTHTTVAALKQKHPKFVLWTLIEDSQIKELVDGAEFTPKAYAENLTLTKFGLTSRETLKKDRKKLRKAKEAAKQ